jgi:hypothetical protein
MTADAITHLDEAPRTRPPSSCHRQSDKSRGERAGDRP